MIMRWMLVLAVVAFVGVAAPGCRRDKEGEPAPGAKAVAQEAPKLCALCGQIKGTAECCKPGAEKCPKCGLAAGSPGCCKLPSGTTEDVELCTACGQIKGSADCCKPGAKKCPKCGLAAGSPGCCRIKAPA